MQQHSIDELWESVPPARDIFMPERIAALPEPTQRYLNHAIAPGTPLATAVRLRMDGEIKLRGWLPFEAEQVITVHHEMIWAASVRMFGLRVSGFDRLLGGEGAMRWKLLGLLPIMSASGSDITRSVCGRLAAEAVWLPSLLCANNVVWSVSGHQQIRSEFSVHKESAQISYALDKQGTLRGLHMQRWGNPDNRAFGYHSFGGTVQEETSFGGYTIPSQLRIGWYADSNRFESEGEFFRATVREAFFR